MQIKQVNKIKSKHNSAIFFPLIDVDVVCVHLSHDRNRDDRVCDHHEDDHQEKQKCSNTFPTGPLDKLLAQQGTSCR